MSTPDIERLHAIKTLPQLLAYLRDELDWPIETEDIEDLTFEYQPEELGLDAAVAVKIKEIKQLRPLTGNQPWGIFWVNFEKKRLPVVIMRCILHALVLKKRASADKAERQSWQPSDLLFISAYGEETDRAITFAHFVENEDYGNLAELRVLGWDDDDTPLKYDYIAHTLQEKLRWRDEFEGNHNLWRQNWREAFVLRHREVITTSKELALVLSSLAKRIRGRVRSILRYKDGFGQIRKLQRAFQQGLIHELSDDDFADMLAQTVTYGLFSVAVRRTFPGEGTAVVRDDVPNLIFTSPFLKEMLGIFLGLKTRKGKLDFDELGLSDVTDLLQSPDTHMEAVLRDFGNRTRQEDPVTHFYELFLTEYDKKRKVQRGVFYTPQPVVSYIVRSVHELLQTEFGLEDGIASTITWGEMLKKHPDLKLPDLSDDPANPKLLPRDEPFIQILDPATGTGTFLVEVIDVVHKTMTAKWSKLEKSAAEISKLWNEYVPKSLLPRLYGYELMMAPYAIAHMKIGLKLSETGYLFGSDERAHIYLTNSLEPKVTQLPHIGFEALAHEAKEVNEVKWYKRFTIVIGNPPYSNFGQLNKIQFILGLLEDYKRGLNEKKINIDDDFIKFVRFSQHLLDESGVGVLGFITNNVYVDGLTHRRMRQSLMETFQSIRVLDLHGSSKRQEQAPDGAKDENVFDITIGVGVALFTRGLVAENACSVVHSELWGERLAKYEALLSASAARTHWAKLAPTTPYFFFVPKDFDQLAEYQRGISVQEMFPLFSSGIQTKRDNVAVAETKEALLSTLKNFARLSASELRSRYDLPDDGRDWRIEWASAHAKEILKSPKVITPILYRPFDARWTVMDFKSKGFVAYPRFEVMSQMTQKNLGLIVTRQLSLPTFQHAFATRQLIDGNTISLQTREYNYLFPLYLQGAQTNQRSFLFDSSGKTNLGPTFLKTLANRLKVPIESDGLPAGLTPEDIFHYTYAMLHSPGYRSRYAEFLKIDFPRLPLTSSLDLFRVLAKLGGELVALHLMESPKLDKHITKWTGGKNPEVEKVTYSNETVWTDKAQTEGFGGVPEPVWNFHIGGYQVCEKWLKDRKDRTLSKNDIEHYQKVVVALAETIRLMAEIDKVIDAHGGWPGAFISAAKDSVSAKSKT